MQESVTPEVLGEINRRIILDYVRKNGPASRAELHRKLNMSAPTVSANVKKLLDAEFLLEVGETNNSVGRKATLLAFNEKRAYIAGVDIGRSQVRILIADLQGQEIVSLKEASDISNLNGQMQKLIEAALSKSNVAHSQLKCIVLGIPGIRDPQSGNAVLAPFADQLDLNALVEMLEKEYSTTVLVENSVNCGIIGEKWQGVAQGYENILYISYGVGIGAGVILNNELFRGASGAAGEIGYMVSGRELLQESFNACGALEQAISGGVIQNILKERGRESELANILQGKAKDEFSDRLLESIVQTVGIVMINMTAMLNPQVIVIGGGFGDLLAEHSTPIWEKMLHRHVPYVPQILRSKLHSYANVLGAVAIAMRYVNDNCFD